MRICIFGAGAVGSFLAARLAHAGKTVSVVARGEHLQAIQQNGLRLKTPDEDFSVRLPASDDPAALGPQDLVIVATKTPALPQVARSMAPLLQPGTAVAFAVNGVYWFYGDGFAPKGIAPDTSRLDSDGTLHKLIGAERSLGIVIYSPNEVVTPGVVHNERSSNRFVIGEALPGSGRNIDRTAAIVEALGAPGMTFAATPDIRREMWAKLVRNSAGSPLCSLTGAPLNHAYADPEIRELAKSLMRETLSVATAHGYGDMGIDPEIDVASSGKLAHKPSMLQDLERGRAMEIDSQLAIVRDFARQAGVATPTLDRILPILTLRARTADCYPA